MISDSVIQGQFGAALASMKYDVTEFANDSGTLTHNDLLLGAVAHWRCGITALHGRSSSITSGSPLALVSSGAVTNPDGFPNMVTDFPDPLPNLPAGFGATEYVQQTSHARTCRR